MAAVGSQAQGLAPVSKPRTPNVSVQTWLPSTGHVTNDRTCSSWQPHRPSGHQSEVSVSMATEQMNSNPSFGGRGWWGVQERGGEEKERRGGIKRWCAAAAPAGAGRSEGGVKRDNDVTVGEGGTADYMNTLVWPPSTPQSSFKLHRPLIGWLAGWTRGVKGLGRNSQSGALPVSHLPLMNIHPST